MTTISHSEVESFLLCERKHYYGYGLGIQRIKESVALNRGVLGHEMLDVFYTLISKGESYADTYEAAKSVLLAAMDGENSDLIIELTRILDMHQELKPFAGFEILAVEQEYTLEITPGVTYPLVLDLLVRDVGGRIAVVDHKFTYDFYTTNAMRMLPQIPKYIAALRALGLRADYGIYHFLRYRKLKEPSPASIIQTIPQYPSEHRVEQTFLEQMEGTNRVLERKALPLEEQSYMAIRTANKMVCENCSFNSICSAELDGENAQLILQAEYKVRERRVFDEIEVKNVD